MCAFSFLQKLQVTTMALASACHHSVTFHKLRTGTNKVPSAMQSGLPRNSGIEARGNEVRDDKGGKSPIEVLCNQASCISYS